MNGNNERRPDITTVKVTGGSHIYYIHVGCLESCGARLVINESERTLNRVIARPLVIIEPDHIFDFIRGFHDALLQSGLVEPMN
jgi:hypothetical protein